MSKWQNKLSINDWNALATSPGEKLEAILWSMQIGKSKQESFFDLVSKLRQTMQTAEQLLGKSLKLTLPELYAPIMFVVNSFEEFQLHNPSGVREIAIRDGAHVADKELIARIHKYIEFADLAYDDRETGEGLVEILAKNGYNLLAHDETTDHEQTAFYVAYHPTEKTCIIGVKGTSTIKDVFTDIICHSDPFLDGSFAHSGMKVAARRLVVRLHSFLVDLFVPLGYKFICTGHSLGAGVAALVAIIMHDELRISNVHAYTYATPPVVDLKSALRCKSYITTVVHDRDVISRTSLSNMNIMHETLFQLSNLLKEGKLTTENIINIDETTHEEHLNGSEVLRLLKNIQEKYKLPFEQDMYCPGNVLYIFRNGKDQYDIVAKDGTLTALRSMIICKTFLSDHAVLQYRNALDSVLIRDQDFNVALSPSLSVNAPGTHIDIIGWQSFYHPDENKHVVYYEIITDVHNESSASEDVNVETTSDTRENDQEEDENVFGFAHGGCARFTAWRRFNDFKQLHMLLKPQRIQYEFPSNFIWVLPAHRTSVLETMLRKVCIYGMSNKSKNVMNPLMDFLGAGKTPAAPVFVKKTLQSKRRK